MTKYCKFRQRYFSYSYDGTAAVGGDPAKATTKFTANGSVLSKL